MATRRLGNYTILGKLGEGGMGAVYRALDLLGQQVALKVLKRELADQDEYRGRFLREARIALSLRHPNIVQTRDAGEADGQLYIASELVEGGNLAALLKREGRLSERRALTFTLGIVRALGFAHQRGLIHRDVKPENVLLTLDEHPKLADLGLARGVSADATRYTRSGEAIGTPCYLSPEQARGEVDLDIRCDLYAVGTTLYELLIGDPPYMGQNFLDVLQAHLYDPIPDPKAKRSDVSLGVSRLIQDLLQKRPRDRPRDPNTVAERIELLLEDAPPDAAAPRSVGEPGGAGPVFAPTVKEAAVVAAERAERRAELPTADEIPAMPGEGSVGGAPSAAAARRGAPEGPAEAPWPAPPSAAPASAAPAAGAAGRPPLPAPQAVEPPPPTLGRASSGSVDSAGAPRPDGAPPAPLVAPGRVVERPPTRERAAVAEHDTMQIPAVFGPDTSPGADSEPAWEARSSAAGRLTSVRADRPLVRAAIWRVTAPGGVTFVVAGPLCVLGRNGVDRSSNDLTVRVLPGQEHRDTNMQISGAHARLTVTDAGAEVTDLGSANGTSLDGAPLRADQPQPLRAGRHMVGLAGVLDLAVTVHAADGPGPAVDGSAPQPATGGVTIDRLRNRPDIQYAVVGGRLPWRGAELLRSALGLYLADPRGVVTLCSGTAMGPRRCLPLAAGVSFEVDGARYEVRPIHPQDMK